MRIALGQFAAGPDKQENRERITRLTDQAARASAELIVFPEAIIAGGNPSGDLVPVAEPLDGPFVAGLAAAARRHGLAIVAGMFEPGDERRVYNTVVAVRPDGGLFGSYRKLHLYDAFGYRESDRIQPGDGATLVFDHAGFRFGVMTCYELRFPEIGRHLCERGAQALLLPAAWVRGPLKELHWETLARARAIENTVFVAANGQVSDRYCGLSTVYDPMGVAIASGGDVEGLVTGDLSVDRLDEVRSLNPSFSNRRPEIYAGWQPVRH